MLLHKSDQINVVWEDIKAAIHDFDDEGPSPK